MVLNRVASWLVFYLVLLSAEALAGDMRIVQAYARATPPGVSTAAVYLSLQNQSAKARRLVAVSSDRAAQVMIHQNQLQGDMMRMRHLAQLDIAANSWFEFKPGGYHLMLTGLIQPLRVGDQLRLKLQFEDGQTLIVRLQVLAVGDDSASERHEIETINEHLE